MKTLRRIAALGLWAVLACACFAAALLTGAGCSQEAPQTGNGTLRLNIDYAEEDADRTIGPEALVPEALVRKDLRFTRRGRGALIFQDWDGADLSIEEGNWTLEAVGFLDDAGTRDAALGVAALTVGTGDFLETNVTMEPISEGGEGVFQWDVMFPEGTEAAVINLDPLAGGEGISIDLLNAAAAWRSLASGFYQLFINLEKDGMTASASETLRVFRSRTSVLKKTVASEDFVFPAGAGDGSDPAGPRLVKDQAGLAAIADGPNLHYALGADITISGEWTPIGSVNFPFTGSLDGRGFHIIWASDDIVFHDVRVRNTGSRTGYGVGLFGLVNPEGVIKNVIVEGAVNYQNDNKKEPGFYAAHIAAVNRGSIENCAVRDDFSLTQNGTQVTQAGGIAGLNGFSEDGLGTIKNCYSLASVSASGAGAESFRAGGIAGFSEGKLFNCFASGEVTLPAAQTSYAGGIAGYHNTNARAEGCVALNTGISGKYTGRIGYKNGTVFGTNWGLDAVEKNGAAGAWTSDETGKDGAAVSAEECALEAWWRDNADWDSVWGLSDDAPWQWNGEAQRPYFWFE